MKKKNTSWAWRCVLVVAVTMTAAACVDEETELGVNLVDPTTMYSGCMDTLYATKAYTIVDDSLMTTGYTYGIVGNYEDGVYGRVSSEIYTQIALPVVSTSISFDLQHFDSVVLTLATDGLFPDSMATYNFHFEVRRLAEPVLNDTLYYSQQSLPVDEGTLYFDEVVMVAPGDSVVRLKMDASIDDVLIQTATAEQFVQNARGLRIRILPDGDQGMLSVNFGSIRTGLTAYYRYGEDTMSSEYTYVIGEGAVHFTHFEHDYAGTVFETADSIGGENSLYLEPLAGHRAVISFDRDVMRFANEHPRAVIHHAELRLPLASTAAPQRPERLIGLRKMNGADTYVADYLSSGADGTYNVAEGYYRMRLTRHLQGLLRDGGDAEGMHVVLDARRSSCANTVLNGINAAKPPMLVVVYSE